MYIKFLFCLFLFLTIAVQVAVHAETSEKITTDILYGIREEMRNIRVNQIAPDLAMAAWDMHFEMKMGRQKPIGEDIRVSAILRHTPEGWRYIYWAESPLTATVYIRKLLERNVDTEKFAEVYERAKKRRGE